MLTKQDLLNQQELIQNDLQCLLDGLHHEVVDRACQIVVDRFGILKDKLRTTSDHEN